MKKKVILITGGNRSGKSRHALKIAGKYGKKAFLATAEPFDEEMKIRIEKHKKERGPEFVNIEAPITIADALKTMPSEIEVVVIDCLTVWIGNLLHHKGNEKENFDEVEELLFFLKEPFCDIILVTNEVGMGLIPADRLSRNFCDIAGSLNQRIAGIADKVIFMISGIDIVVKGDNDERVNEKSE